MPPEARCGEQERLLERLPRWAFVTRISIIATVLNFALTTQSKCITPSELQRALQAARSDSAPERLEAANQLGSAFYQGEETKKVAIAELLRLLQDKQWFVRLAAVDQLNFAYEPSTVDDLSRALQREQNDTVKEHLTSTVNRISSSLDYQLLLFESTDPAKRKDVLSRWAYSSDERVRKAIIKLLNDPVEAIRLSAADTLVQLKDPAVIDFEINLLESGNNDTVRTFAAAALGKFHSQKATDALVRALSSSNHGVHDTAAIMLADMGDPHAINALVSSLPLSSSARLIGWRLAKFGDAAETPLIDALRSPNQATRVGAAEALAFFKSSRTVEALTSASHDPDASVRSAANSSLASLKN